MKRSVVYCIDELNPLNRWQKEWYSLGENIKEVYTRKETENLLAQGASLDGVVLILIHDSAFDPRGHRGFEERIAGLKKQPYLMRVGTDRLNSETRADGRRHSSGIEFPNRSSLSHLKEQLAVLVKNLAKIPRNRGADSSAEVQKRFAAWNQWEHSRLGLEILPALAILCQGYLAAHVNPADGILELRRGETTARASCLKALELMGWKTFVENSTRGEFNLPAELREQELRKRLQDEVRETSWWQIFGPDNLSAKAAQEWGKDWDVSKSASCAAVGELLKFISRKRKIKPDSVAEAFLALSRKLENRPCNQE